MNAAALSDMLLVAYGKQQDRLIADRLKIAAVLSILIAPSAALMDWFVYHDDLKLLLTIRLICAVLLGIILFILYRPHAVEKSHLLAQIWVNIMLGYNAAMIAVTNGVVSPYYAGINLVVLGATLLLPWTVKENLFSCGASMVWYFAACGINWLFVKPSVGENWFSIFFNNSFIMLSNVIICGTAGYFAERLRFRDFQLQYELSENRRALEESYKQLDQGKQELEKSYQKLEELDRAKSQFFANISHELRTPLTLILSPLDSLRSHPEIARIEKAKSILDIMHENGLRLLALINDLLDLVKLEDGKMELHLEPVDLRRFLPGLISSTRLAAEKCGLLLESNIDESSSLIVKADKDRLEKIFLNLIFNAIKFTPKGGKITVAASINEGSIWVDVRDTGIGIAPENLNAVFGRFWQEDGGETRVRQGTGIGLALVKELVDLHGGKISVSSEKGVGSTFRVELPKSDSEAMVESEVVREDPWLNDLYRKAQFSTGGIVSLGETLPEEQSKERHRHTLLIVEDEPDMQRFLVSELEGSYNVILASDGYSGWELAHQHQPKLIITDMMLPKMDGIALCRQLRSSPSLLPTKIILLTARADDRTKLTALEAGADDFLVKPFSIVELKTRLKNLLLTGQLERELQTQNQTLQETLQQLRAAEAQLIQNARLSALGSLSAGIMHEINNPVNFMITAVHYLKGSIPKGTDDALEAAKDIEDGLKRVRDIIADLKGFAYGGTVAGAKANCAPEKILRTAKRLLATEIKEDVIFEEQIDDAVSIFGNENQLVQLIVNLIQNALQATEKNKSSGKERRIIVRAVADPKYAMLVVWDNGTGIDESIRSKIFDPFFTTKEVGQGTGLGLSICHTIVKQHNGEIQVRSEVGRFTEMTVRIPLHQPSPVPDKVGV